MRNRWSSGISDHCAGNRAHGAEHQPHPIGPPRGGITPHALRPEASAGAKRLKISPNARTSLFICGSRPNIVMLQVTLELRPQQWYGFGWRFRATEDKAARPPWNGGNFCSRCSPNKAEVPYDTVTEARPMTSTPLSPGQSQHFRTSLAVGALPIASSKSCHVPRSTDDDKIFIESCIYFFMATGRRVRTSGLFPSRGGARRDLSGSPDRRNSRFPDYDGKRHVSRVSATSPVNPHVGLLFIAMHGNPKAITYQWQRPDRS